MTTIVTRAGKGSPLTHDEVDANFTNLNTDKLEKTSADFTPQTAPSFLEGRVWYDSSSKALSYYNDITNTSLQIGYESWVRVRNSTGSTIVDGSVVIISGATGQTPTITLADADIHTPAQVIGVVTADIANNAQGNVTISGLVNNLNTSAFNDGDVVYLSQTAGQFTATPPTGSAAVVAIGIIAHAHATQGKLLVGVKDAKSYLSSSAIGVTVQGYDVDTAKLDVAQSWTATQKPDSGTAAVSTTSTYTFDGADQIREVTFTNAITVTFGAPTGVTENAYYTFKLKAGDTSARTFAWNSAYKFPAATSPLTSGTTTNGAFDIITFVGGASNTLQYVGHAADVR